MDANLLRPTDLPSPVSSGRSGRLLHAIFLAAGLVMLCGCSLMPWRKGPDAVTTPSAPDAEASAPGETGPPAPQLDRVESRERSGRRSAVADTTALPPRTAVPAIPEATAPSITIQLTEAERTRLIDETEKEMALITACLRRLDGENLDDGQRGSLADIQDLLKAVTKARDEGDVQAASRLARKARLLAEDLAAK